MIFGLSAAPAPTCYPRVYKSRYPHGGTQLKEAVSFLHAHRQSVDLVTIDIGANNVIFGGGGVPAIEANLPVILAALRNAVGPGVPIVGMNTIRSSHSFGSRASISVPFRPRRIAILSTGRSSTSTGRSKTRCPRSIKLFRTTTRRSSRTGCRSTCFASASGRGPAWSAKAAGGASRASIPIRTQSATGSLRGRSRRSCRESAASRGPPPSAPIRAKRYRTGWFEG